MVYDDIIVGSGLTALAAATGLGTSRRILVLASRRDGEVRYYDRARGAPRAFDGYGGLGNYWHGVIPTAMSSPFARRLEQELKLLFSHFYPRDNIASRLGLPWLFIPRRPIRPVTEWTRLSESRQGKLDIRYEDALSFEEAGKLVSVRSNTGVYRANRLWVGAGTFGTPKLLASSLGRSVSREAVSDHFICYRGQINRRIHRHITGPRLERDVTGFWMEARFDATEAAMLTMRPARFDYRWLDYGFEQRQAFGLKTASAISKIMQAGSPGLINEALFNKFGLFANAKMQSVYAQVLVKDAYRINLLSDGVEPSLTNITHAIGNISSPWPEITPTKRPDLFLQGIHLHHSVDVDAMMSAGIGQHTSPVQVIDPSVMKDIGPEHHSFYAMANAFRLTRNLAG